jgi:hypothetical protein
MSDIPYYFETPVPQYFRKNGWFDCENTFKFVTWSFSKCSTKFHKVVHDGKELNLAPFEFIAGRNSSGESCFLTPDEFRTQLISMQKAGLLKKSPNSVPNRFTCYTWVTEAFGIINPQLIPLQIPNSSPTDPHKPELQNHRIKEPTEPTPTPSESVVSVGQVFGCLVGLVLSEKDKQRLSQDFKEQDVIRAVAVLSENKKSLKSVMGFLISAIKNNYKPKGVHANKALSTTAQENRNNILKFKETFRKELSVKDIPINDMIDHIDFNGLKVDYESISFGKEIGIILEKLNLLHLIRHDRKAIIETEENKKIVSFANVQEICEKYLEN